eukprot:CAMPEP_0174695846 /NCGR_PEP_ID=MMETSP1094-20130205/2140_1 /TAXON_ID=156173 /ORGANISM="Chrysochromulina brevifilum, Strain UTEX LB 985" /LENGTH=54 /DNA_ID=CAMNT_0015892455 /DNA_START=198 /DNA_END=362 /DNA_ORIENTATION=+
MTIPTMPHIDPKSMIERSITIGRSEVAWPISSGSSTSLARVERARGRKKAMAQS